MTYKAMSGNRTKLDWLVCTNDYGMSGSASFIQSILILYAVLANILLVSKVGKILINLFYLLKQSKAKYDHYKHQSFLNRCICLPQKCPSTPWQKYSPYVSEYWFYFNVALWKPRKLCSTTLPVTQTG